MNSDRSLAESSKSYSGESKKSSLVTVTCIAPPPAGRRFFFFFFFLVLSRHDYRRAIPPGELDGTRLAATRAKERTTLLAFPAVKVKSSADSARPREAFPARVSTRVLSPTNEIRELGLHKSRGDYDTQPRRSVPCRCEGPRERPHPFCGIRGRSRVGSRGKLTRKFWRTCGCVGGILLGLG